MRPVILSLLLCAGLAQAQPVAPNDLQPLFEQAGVRLLCEQTEPFLRRGLPESAAQGLGTAFAADNLCAALAQKVAAQLTRAQLAQAQQLLSSPLALRFVAAEREVANVEPVELEDYRKQLAERPPRGPRLELVRRLDRAAHTSDLAHRLRYEIGKTQAWMVLKASGERLGEAQLSERTATQGEALRVSSVQGVESFMLFAYRRIPSAELQAYAELHESKALALLLGSTAKALPEVFAERRAALP